jgi:magnesium-protoporphyrin O-methyltransferase
MDALERLFSDLLSMLVLNKSSKHDFLQETIADWFSNDYENLQVDTESTIEFFNDAYEGHDNYCTLCCTSDQFLLDNRMGIVNHYRVSRLLRCVTGSLSMNGVTVCDAGCGTGSLAIPLALSGAAVSASDISSAMVGEAEVRFNNEIAAGKKAPSVAPKFEALGLEECSGKYDVVTCIDVMIHYPTDRVNGMINHLASLSEDKLIVSFAPKTLAYSILKRVGELFPGPSKATRAYLHAEEDVESALKAAGFKVTRREMTATQFYFSRLLECERV